MRNVHFLYPYNIIFSVIAIVILLLFIMGKRKKKNILETFKIQYNKPIVNLGLISMALGLLCIVLALMAPVQNEGIIEEDSQALDIYVLLDTSKSMLTQDILPSRIERAKLMINSLLEELEGDRIGIIPFSSTAYIQMPLTDDYGMAKLFVDVIDTDMISGGGTDLFKAINLAHQSFEVTQTANQVIVILSDGEAHDDKTLSKVKDIGSEQLRIYSIGIGTIQGGLIPEYDHTGSQKIGYKKDDQGEVVLSKLNEELLIQLAEETEGMYYRASLRQTEIDSLINEIKDLNREVRGINEVKHYKHLYQYFLGTGVLLILVGWVLAERRRVRD